MAQARDDRQLATRLYLNSRATALRVEKRNDEVVKRAGVVEALSKEPEHLAGEAPPTTTPVASAQASVRGGLLSRRKHLIAVAGVAGGIIIAVVAFLALRSGSSLPQPANAARAVAAARAIAPKTAIPKAPEVSAEDFAAKIRVQKEAGNWNLLVINASEWARRQPSNLDAWKELSVGYVKLRQWNDALDATKKAADLAPDDLLLWQTLGQVNMELKRPVDALEAFQRATAINERDVGSWVQQGVLNMQIRRLPDAKVAFERALAVSPGDTEALCGAASLAQKEEREKDALALNRQVAAAGARCPEPPPVESAVVKSTQAPAKPARKPH
ncbi:MAG TPA: hypothetical protein VF420_07980 [Casimicrobiaceae bacterium]